ncbi:uncharacterized protein [Amphiura filiformis]|uniref:uncharacterized protein n=1 Tax=Amphiura filiformis TaxID=82378 RepID=UPI003B220DA3
MASAAVAITSSQGSGGPGGYNTLRFVMVGMTGTGKSALGNSILAWGILMIGQLWTKLTKPFRSKTSTESVTVNCKKQEAVVLGRNVSIVDTPGFLDTETTSKETIKELTKSVLMVAPGPHAILLVIKVGRFTPEVVNGIDLMKKIFGDKSVDYLIIVFTHIDSLDDEETLEEFVDSMKGSPRQLVDECKHRYVGFNNKFAPTSDENRQQVQELFKFVDGIRADNVHSCYTNDLLEEAQKIMNDQQDAEEVASSPAVQGIVEKIKSRCFASDSTVKVQNCHGHITVKCLEDLAVGDLVQSYDPQTSSVTYSPVYYIIYKDENDRKSTLRELFYQGNDGKERSLRLHGKHLLYATIKPSTSLDSGTPPSIPIMSEMINIGDILWVLDDDIGELCPRRVFKIVDIVANVRHPMTMNHTIIVDGVLASVHAHNEWLLRQATAPLRLLHKISPAMSDLWLSKKAVQGWDYVEHYFLE